MDSDPISKVPNASAHLVNMMKYGFFAMNLLPDVASPGEILNFIFRTIDWIFHILPSSKGIIIVSDGAFSQPDPVNVDILLTQLRNASVRVFIINMSDVNNGNPSSLHDFGVLPSIDFLQFLTTATVGACLVRNYDCSDLKNL